MQIDPERLTAVNPSILYVQLTKFGYHYDAAANAWGVTIDPRIKNKLTNDSGANR
jgi:crotonobetainyl-CoA:carnitine CoA-transferase CaiB-like acyl-CoA transferase